MWVAQHDAADGGADAAGSHVVITVADDQDLVADKARHGDPARDGHAQDQGLDAGGRDIGDQDQDDGGGDVIADVVQLGEEEPGWAARCLSWMQTAALPGWQAARRITSRQRASSGATRCTTGPTISRPAMPGGSSVSAMLFCL